MKNVITRVGGRFTMPAVRDWTPLNQRMFDGYWADRETRAGLRRHGWTSKREVLSIVKRAQLAGISQCPCCASPAIHYGVQACLVMGLQCIECGLTVRRSVPDRRRDAEAMALWSAYFAWNRRKLRR